MSDKYPQKYSQKWFDITPDDILKSEREIVRKQFVTAGKSQDRLLAVRLQNLLYLFDRTLNERAWGDEIPHGPSYHREHGYNLYKDD